MDLKETETEENYVRRLATGLCTVRNNNPKAFTSGGAGWFNRILQKWIFWVLQKKRMKIL